VRLDPHSAAGQAAGYQYQSEQALLRLLRLRQPRVSVFIEALDDFHLEDQEGVLDVVQAKHQLRSGNITDTSADLWRTINVWINVLGELEADELPSFLLLTTSRAQPDTIAALLRSDDARDPTTAHERLTLVAVTDTGQTTAGWRERFAALPPEIRERLVSAIIVADEQPPLQAIIEELKRELAPTIRAEHLIAFVERLRGWWFEQVARMLTGRLTAVAIEDLWQFLQDLRDGFSLNDLPFEYLVPEPTEDETAAYAAATFTSQLRIVDVAEERIGVAIRDYHRAYANTSRWAREGLLLPGELNQYELRIVEEWDRHFGRMRQDLGDPLTEEAMQSAGRRMWERLDLEVDLPRLRERLDERTIPRGTLHTLADDERVGWHPEFRERLRALLAQLADEH
jgi:hypothetical protein